MSTSTELYDWLNGTATGGPNGDGRYPLTAPDGTVHLVYCPAAQALHPPAGDPGAPSVFADAAAASAQAAQGSATAAAGSATAASNSAATAATKATNATTEATNAAASAVTTAGYMAAAAASAAAAETTRTDAAADAAAALSTISGYVTSAETASTAAAGAQTSAEMAQSSAEAAQSAAAASAASAASALADIQSAVTGILRFKGVWDASGNTYPSAPAKGDFWKISVAGTVGGVDLAPGDQIYYGGSTWDKIDNTEQVTTVAGRIGNVVIAISDLAGLQTALDARAVLNSSPVFTGSVTAGQTFASAGATMILCTGATGTAYIRPDGVASATGQLSVATTGITWNGEVLWRAGNFDPSTKANLNGANFTGAISSTNNVTAAQNFISSSAAAVLAATSATGQVILRPAGPAASAGQLIASTTGVTWDGNQVWHAGTFDPSTKQAVLGYTPVQNGTGVGQLTNLVKIGWKTGSKLGATVDSTDIGNVAVESWVTSNFLSQGDAAGKADKSGATFTGEVISTAANTYRTVAGNYGAFWRNDGNDLYLLFTASGDQYGQWNTLRPLRVNIATGLTYIGNGLNVVGNFSASGTIDGSNITSTVVGNNIVQRNASGYIMANYVNTTANVATAVPSHIAIQNSSDSYIRWQTPAQFRANMKTPQIFVQSTDPGAAAADGDLWFW